MLSHPYSLVSLFLFLFPGVAVAGGDGDGHLVSSVGIAVVAASVTTIVFHRLKLPALLAYIISGVLIGAFGGVFISDSVHLINEVSHIGLVFLLFIIGLEMDLNGMLRLGPRTGLAIVLQAPIAIAAVYGLQWALHQAGLALPGLGSHPDAWFYYAVATALGSTAVVVKLLGDKFDLGSQAGKITVSTLIMQDIWAVTALSYVKSQGGGSDTTAWLMVGGGIVLAVTFVLVSRFILSRVMAWMARSPELLMLVALGWCFLSAEAFAKIGLSAEMGALIAGLTIGRLPEHTEVLAKVASLRDFFMALFFVALGISLPTPTPEILLQAAMLAGFVVAARIVLFAPTLLAGGQGPIVSFAAPTNLAQLSEFTLLVIPVGVANGALSENDQIVISYGLMISVVLSAFMIANNYRLAMLLGRVIGMGVEPRAGAGDTVAHGHAPSTEIIMLGYFVNTEAILRHIRKVQPDLLQRILVIDFNIASHHIVRAHGVHVAYGDISNPETLRHLGIADAKVIVSTISNAFLHGIRNEELLAQVKMLNPDAHFVTTSLSAEGAEKLVEGGAFACISTPDESAPAFTQAIADALNEKTGASLTTETTPA